MILACKFRFELLQNRAVHFLFLCEKNLVGVSREDLQFFAVSCLQFCDTFRKDRTENDETKKHTSGYGGRKNSYNGRTYAYKVDDANYCRDDTQ